MPKGINIYAKFSVFFLLLGGIIGVVSGVVDFYYSYYISNEFKNITIEGYNYRVQHNKPLNSENVSKFLTFAYGEFTDLCQKRGCFNRDKYFSGLLKW
ncbi:MAG: hypothetical protein CNLJKLNK_00425 [Holosporales bacterium]